MTGPRYLELHERGELARRAAAAVERLAACALCPRACGVDRLAGERGECGAGRRAAVASAGLHFGEEAPLVGTGGSGTIFFAGCNLHCRFCQNHDISHAARRGDELEPEDLAGVMVGLQRRGAHNLNLVTPSHVGPQVLEALCLAAEAGLRLPLVYNTSGYDGLDALALLDGVVDVYMPDAKVASRDVAERALGAADYPERARAALREMHRQVGELQVDGRGVATRGLLVRHLVLPGGAAGTAAWMSFIATELSPRTTVNLMAQYHPAGPDDLADLGLDRRVTRGEMDEAYAAAADAGLTRLDGRHRP